MSTRNLIAAIAFSALALTTTACNTVDGAGDDLKSASREVKKEI
ncbi:Entericidin EcnA/B family protein [Porphyrobacter sp. ULC335]|nr:Entericidin EcnA/B family protein [Porphyrobacter sp. ULC335]UYV14263.1 Entericidin EcnA/B family protein [Porphyrobacter sp. ULC335]